MVGEPLDQQHPEHREDEHHPDLGPYAGAPDRGARCAGFYTLRAGDQEDVFAANLGPSEEAVIEPAEQLELGGARAPRPAIGRAGVRTEIWMVLVLAVLGVVLVEWFTYHRRLTV